MSINPTYMKFVSLIGDNKLIEAKNYLKEHNIDINLRPTPGDKITISYAKDSDIHILKFLLEENIGNIIALTESTQLFIFTIKLYKLINKGINPQSLFDSAFIFGCAEGALDIAKYGFYNNANIHAHKDLALNFSCKNNQVDSVIYLMSKGVKITEKELLISSIPNYNNYMVGYYKNHNDYDLLKFLLKNVHFPNLFDCSDELMENLIGRSLSYSPFSVSQDVHDILVDLAFNHKIPYTKKIQKLLEPNKELTTLFSKKELFIKLNDNLIKNNNKNSITKI